MQGGWVGVATALSPATGRPFQVFSPSFFVGLELVGWVNLELTGYPNEVPVPEYRVLSGQVRSTISDGMHIHNDQPLPTVHLVEDLRLKLERYEARESISAL